jgi:uncharacterized protein (TIGR00255 family)
MTGYANAQREFAGGRVAVELRSVNSRFLDLQFRMPDDLRSVEPALREAITQAIVRGKVECRVALQRAEGLGATSGPDPDAMTRLFEWQSSVRRVLHDAPLLSVADVLRWPGVIGDNAFDPDALRDAVMDAARDAIAQFVASRGREGERLCAYLLERVAQIETLVGQVRPRLPTLREAYQRKITERLGEALGQTAPNGTSVMSREEIAARLAAEASLFGMRADVDEELSRLDAHLAEVRRVVGKPAAGGIGKRLDFIMQELNREANTLGSKAVAIELADASIELKLLIEQMREQIQNLE